MTSTQRDKKPASLTVSMAMRTFGQKGSAQKGEQQHGRIH